MSPQPQVTDQTPPRVLRGSPLSDSRLRRWARVSVLVVMSGGWACLATGCRPSAPPPAKIAAPGTTPVVATLRTVQFEKSQALDAAQVIYRNGEESGQNAILESLGGGVGLVDYDRDGQLDLCFPGGGEVGNRRTSGWPLRLLRQRAVESFQDTSAVAGVNAARHYSHGCSAADYNNDGFPDLLITGYGGLTLWTNMGDGTFQDETSVSGLNDSQWSSSAAWGDLNGDGVLDLYVAHYVNWSFDNHPPCPGPSGHIDVCPPRQFDGLTDALYFGQGDGSFVDQTKVAGLVPEGKGLSVMMVDVDQDADLDLYVANDTVADFLYMNDGHGELQERAMLAGVAVDDMAAPTGSMGIALLDYDQDQRPDLWVTTYENELFSLFQNLGAGSFQHVSRRAGLNRIGTLFVGFGCIAADLDADGDEDIAVANGHVVHHPRNAPIKQARLVMLNQGNGQFERFHSSDQGDLFEQPDIGRGLASGDLDHDGFVDLVFTNTNSPANLFYTRVQATDGHPIDSLDLRLIGTRSTRDAQGARVVLETSAGKSLRGLTGGGSYLSSSEMACHWHWPKDATPQRLVIDWPSGKQTVIPIKVNASPSAAQHLRWTILEPVDDSPVRPWSIGSAGVPD